MTSQDQSQWPSIPQPGTSLADWQTYVDELVRARGWDKASDLETFLLFTEEVGELAKAYRRHRNLFTEHSKATESSQSKEELASELADVLSYVFDLARRLDIDLEEAAIRKEEINRGRHWD